MRQQLVAAERAIAAAGGRQERVDGAGTILASLRADATGTPETRRAILRALIDQGGIVVTATGARVELWIPRPAKVASHGEAASESLALVTGPCYRREHETHLRIRLVA